VRVLYFAQARLATTLSEENLETSSPLFAQNLWQELVRRHPKLAAVLPPVSGG